MTERPNFKRLRYPANFRRATIALVACLTLGWGGSGVRGADRDAARAAQEPGGGAAAGTATIYFYRHGRFVGAITHFSAYVGDKFLAEIHNDDYASLEVPAGPVTVTSGTPITGQYHLPTKGEWASMPGCAGLNWRRLAAAPALNIMKCRQNLANLKRDCESGGSPAWKECNYKLNGSFYATELLQSAMWARHVRVDAEPGKSYYVRWTLSLTEKPVPNKLELVDEATGAKEIKHDHEAKERDDGPPVILSDDALAAQLAASETARAAENFGDTGMDDMKQAVKSGDAAKVQELLEKDPELVTRRDHGSTALHSAVVYQHMEVVKVLLASGADVNALDNGRMTPLHYAAVDGLTEIAEFLIENGANVNARQRNGLTPLHMAIMEKHKETAEVIKKHGGKK
jgi:hypothetical protein